MEHGIVKQRYRVVDPHAEALAARIARAEQLWNRCRSLLRAALAALVGFTLAFLFSALLAGIARWPGQ